MLSVTSTAPEKTGVCLGGRGGGGGTVSRTNDQLLKFRHLQHVLNMDKFP